jgi:uncharacterized SAM-binding protein YcdF (DUF218 family)
MTKTDLDKIFKWGLLIFGAVILLDAFFVTVVSTLNVGIYLTYAFGAFLLFLRFAPLSLIKSIPLFLRYLVVIGIIILLVFVSFLYIYGNVDNVTYEEDAVIVLGAGLRGENVSQHLKNRLDAAIVYHENNPDALIVVSGGQGVDEVIDEATAMERYIVKHGVPTEKIVKESLSTSTEENFLFSKQILDDYFEDDYKIAYITNDFHAYRSGCRAKAAGFSSITHYGAKTPLHSVLPNGFREVSGVLEFWCFDNLERDSFIIPLLILFKR